MIAGMLIYVPAIANFHINRLQRPAGCGQYRSTGAGCCAARHGADSLSRQILKSIGARAVAIKMGQQRSILASDDLPPTIDRDIDLRTMSAWSGFWIRQLLKYFL